MTRSVSVLFTILFLAAGQATTLDGDGDPNADPLLTGFDREQLVELSAVHVEGPLVFHHVPGDTEHLAEDVAANLAAFHELQGLLDMRYEGRIHVFLYPDAGEMARLTDGASDIAFSTGTVSIHQVRDFRGVHELTHIFALRFAPEPDGAGPDMFLTEGLATAMAKSDQGVPVHAWAATYLAAGRLPRLTDLRRTWPEGAGSAVHPYHVAASFVLHLVERFGIDAVKRYYVNSTEAWQVFGHTLPRLEREWRAFLEEHEVESSHRAHVLDVLGLSDDPLPTAWADAPGMSLLGALDDGRDAGTALPGGLTFDDPSLWSMRDGLLVGRHDGPWTKIRSKEGFGPDVGLRVRFRLVSGDALQLRVNDTTADENEAIFAAWCTYLSDASSGYLPNDSMRVPMGSWCEAVLVNQGGRGRLFLNGVTVLDRQGAFHREVGSVGLAVERGELEIAEAVVFDPGDEG